MNTEATDDRDDRLDHSDLTDAERGELEGATDANAAAGADAAGDGDDAAAAGERADAAGADADAGAAAAVVAEDDDRATVRAALETATRAADAATRALEASRQPPAAAADDGAPKPRDYDAELKALKAQYDAGDIDRDAYDDQRDALRDARSEALVEARVAQRLQQHETQTRQATWEQSYKAFVALPENSRLTGPAMNAGFNSAIQAIYEANPHATFDQLLTAARQQVFDEAGLALPTARDPQADAKKIAAAVDQRRPQQTERPVDVGALPRAGADSAAAADEQLDALPIDQLEERLARMAPDRVEAYLAGAPGGLGDHARQVA